MVSVNNWRISRLRLAPNDSRTAISFRRSAALASIMFATFTHAISNASPPSSSRKSLRNGMSCFRTGTIFPPLTRSTRRPF
jgi:hypothetical protein